MLKHGEPNPLNVFNLRQLDHCPPHFEKVIFDLRISKKDIVNWIFENLDGRFYHGLYDTISENGNLIRKYCVAFESHGEASFFSLMLSQINNNSSSVF